MKRVVFDLMLALINGKPSLAFASRVNRLKATRLRNKIKITGPYIIFVTFANCWGNLKFIVNFLIVEVWPVNVCLTACSDIYANELNFFGVSNLNKTAGRCDKLHNYVRPGMDSCDRVRFRLDRC